MNTAAASLGAKAASLVRLQEAGFPVPPWVVLQAEFLEEWLVQTGLDAPWRAVQAAASAERAAALAARAAAQVWPEALERRLHQWCAPLLLEGPVAVRSSGSAEDLERASFAGQYRTVLQVADAEALRAAVLHCWAALLEPRLLAYARRAGVAAEALRLALIVQRMVAAQAAGVVFTLDPVNGWDDEILIEAVAGLGDALVDGRATPQRLRLGHGDGALRAHDGPAVLAPAQAEELAQLAAEVQAAFGYPLDLEWAHDGRRFWLLQARPITRTGSSAYPGEWTTADFKDGGVSAGVCTPLMASLYEHVLTRSLPGYLDGVGLTAREPEREPWYCVAYGRPYWNARLVKRRLARLPGFCEREFDQGLGVAARAGQPDAATPYTPRTLWHGWRVLRRLRASFRARQERNAALLPELAADGARLERRLLEGLDLAAAGRAWRELIEGEYTRCESAYFGTIYDNSNAQTLLRTQLHRIGAAAPAVLLRLLGGLADLSHLRPSREQAAIVRELRSRPPLAAAFLDLDDATLARRYLAGLPFPGDHCIRPFLYRYGWLAAHTLELQEARWNEDPRPLFAALRRSLAAAGEPLDPEHGEALPAAQYREERARVLARAGRWRAPALARSLDTARALLWWREELRAASTRMYAQVRRYALALGRAAVRAGALTTPEDVFFLTWREAAGLASGDGPPAAATAAVRGRRRHYLGYRNYRNPNEFGGRYDGERALPPAPAAAEGARWTGIAGAAGRYRGRARVLRSVAELGRVQRGEVLVTAYTDPGWTAVFPLLGAVVTETGGVLSHAAVIARECGFPAVLAVAGATTCLRDGDWVEVDGDAGCVRRTAP